MTGLDDFRAALETATDRLMGLSDEDYNTAVDVADEWVGGLLETWPKTAGESLPLLGEHV